MGSPVSATHTPSQHTVSAERAAALTRMADVVGSAHAIVALSRLALDEEHDVADAEINPLLVRREGEGVVALDALVRLA